ncbi:hypothetical protein RF819_02835 [Rhodoferax fermentans]|uniref:Uncharacterized protein n=1 Tax=Rhodoferax fermentans TaxID=28066 RepID=A0A1T1AP51_RHOFE|nr:hypothetical protein RF819_02835 [Rhodoferax fermentans]
MQVNQRGEPVVEEHLFRYGIRSATDDERDTAIVLILEHLGLVIVKTNATKHGTTELELRKEAP